MMESVVLLAVNGRENSRPKLVLEKNLRGSVRVDLA